MRISDWSSDVGSADLKGSVPPRVAFQHTQFVALHRISKYRAQVVRSGGGAMSRTSVFSLAYGAAFAGIVMAAPVQAMDQAGYDSAQATLASAIYDLEGKLIEKEAIVLKSKALEPQMDSIQTGRASGRERVCP